MAIYHCSIKIITRGKGKPAIAAAAYRAGEKIVSEYNGKMSDYTRKKGIVYKEILLPYNAPREYADRAVLWNAVEKIEKAKNAQLAREIEISLPVELSLEQNVRLIRSFVDRQFVMNGMCADICMHDTGAGNPHAHIMLTMRPLNEDGSWGDKQRKVYQFDEDGKKIYDPIKRQYKCSKKETTNWNDRGNAEIWRSAWADACNAALKKQNLEIEIDHRSYERQGIEQIPTVHLGVAAHQMEQKGIRTERGDKNREIEKMNAKIRQNNARIRKLQTWVKGERDNTPPTLADLFSAVLSRDPERTQKEKIYDLQLVAKALIFVEQNGIRTLADMNAYLAKMKERNDELKSQSFKISRRLPVLSEHLKHADNYIKNRKVYEHWRDLKEGTPAERKYYKNHNDEITAWVDAHKYFTRVMNGNKKLPIDEWKREFADKTAQQNRLIAESQKINAELKNAEAIKRLAERVTGVEPPRRKRTQGMEL